MLRLNTVFKSHWAIIPTVIFLASRVLQIAFMNIAAQWQYIQSSKLPNGVAGQASYVDLVANWDSFWYFSIAANGYPSEMYEIEGVPEQTPLAFYPLWPYMLRGFSFITNLSLPMAAAILAPTLAFLGILFLYKTISATAGQRYAILVTAWISFLPMSTVFQLAYTESLAFLLIAMLFYFIHAKKHLWVIVSISALAFTRPITIALALAFFSYWAYQKFVRKDTTVTKYWLFLSGYSAFAFAWYPLYCAFLLKDWLAYFKIQEAWQVYQAGKFFTYSNFSENAWPFIGVVIALLITGLALWKNSWPILMKCWAASYVAYLIVALPIAFYATTVPDSTYMTYAQVENHTTVVFNTSLARYYMLAVFPLVPISFFTKAKTMFSRAFLASLVFLIIIVANWYYIITHVIYNSVFAIP